MRALLPAAASFLVACATGYHPMGFGGGYEDTQLGPNRYFIHVRVNSYTSRGTAMEYFHTRAAELCPAGYDLLDRDADTRYVRYGNYAYAKPEVDGVVECRPMVRTQYGPPGGGESTWSERR